MNKPKSKPNKKKRNSTKGRLSERCEISELMQLVPVAGHCTFQEAGALSRDTQRKQATPVNTQPNTWQVKHRAESTTERIKEVLKVTHTALWVCKRDREHSLAGYTTQLLMLLDW